MKRKSLLPILLLLIFTPVLKSQNTTIASTSRKVEIYYFHPTERCPIDQSIEENTRQTVQTYFSKEIKNGSVRLLVLNTDDKANTKIVSRFDIKAQALYIVKTENTKEIKTDLTSFAFDYGKSNPQKFKIRLKDEIETALK